MHILSGRVYAHTRLLIVLWGIRIPWFEDQTGHVRVSFRVFRRGALMVFMNRAHSMMEVLKVRGIDTLLTLAELLGGLGGEAVALFTCRQTGGLHDGTQRIIIVL